METLCRLSYRGNERNSRGLGFALATPLPVRTFTAGLPSEEGLTTEVVMVAGEGFEPP